MLRAANMSSDGEYRWQLSRQWGSGAGTYMVWMMLNPSTANHLNDDPTILRCIGFAKGWGFAGLIVVNLFAVRMTDPKALSAHPDPVGPENAYWLNKLCRNQDGKQESLVVAAWGAHPAARALFGLQVPHSTEVVAAVKGLRLHCLGVTKDGHPRHPLYVRGDAELQPWPTRSA